MISGCYYYKVTKSSGPPRDDISKIQDSQKFIILHLDDKAWQFTGIIVDDGSVTGKISELIGHEKYKTTNPERANRYIRRARLNESDVLNEVHIYVNGFSETENGKITIPTSDIQKIELYDKDSGATTASWVFGSLGVAAGAFAILLVIVALTKSSCPFVYAWDGTDFYFTGEIFSGATQPGLERDDYLPLPRIASSDGIYSLRLTNEVREIQSVNLAELICIDHPTGLSVLIDKYGKVNTFRKPLPPVSAVNTAGMNLLPVIGGKDSLYYSGDETGSGKNGVEEVVMKFLKPDGAGSAKLVVRAKNSFWLDILFTKFHGLFGEKYIEFAQKQESESGENLEKYLLDQKIPLSVYIEKDGKWEFMDYFNIAGPMAMRDDVINLDLAGISSDTVTVRLETGFLFWELDFAAIDYSVNEKVFRSVIPVSRAIDNHDSDIQELLRSRDKDYVVLKEIGDETLLEFENTGLQGPERSVFLHSSGFYKILRDQEGYADRKTLKTFKNPNRFPVFSKETYNQLRISN